MKPQGKLLKSAMLILLFCLPVHTPYCNAGVFFYAETVKAQTSVAADSMQIVRLWITEAQLLRRQLNQASALELLDKAEAYLERNPDIDLQYMLFTERGFFYRWIGDYDQAKLSFKRILDFIDEDDAHRNAVVNNSIATLLRETGEFVEALNYHHRSLQYRFRVQNGGELGLAATYLNYARTFDDLNRLDQSLVMYERALHYATLINHRRLYMEIVSSFANVLNRLGNFDAAMLYYREGLEAAQEFGETRSKSLLYSALGLVHLNLGEPEAAKYNYERSYAMVKEVNLPWVVRLKLSYLDILLKTGDTVKAHEVMSATEEIIGELGSQLETADFIAQKAYLSYLNSDYISAARYFREAGTRYIQAAPYRIEPEFYFRKAFNLIAINEQAGLIQAGEALEYLEKFRLETALTGNTRAEYFSELSRYVSEIVLIYMKKGDAAKAFDVAERLKSRVFSEELNLSSLLSQSLIEINRQQDFEVLQAGIISLENQVLQAADPIQRDMLQMEIEQQQLRLEALLGEVSLINPALHELMNPPRISLAQAAAQLDQGAVGLHIVTGGSETGYLAFTNTETRQGVVSLSGKELAENVTGVRERIISGLPLSELKPFLDEVTTAMIPVEILEILAGAKELIISVDGVWAYLPVAALRYRDTYFAETKTISFTPSFTARSLLNQRHLINRNGRREALVFANPVIPASDPDARTSGNIADMQNLRPLPFSELEGRWVAEFFPGAVRLKTGTEARETVLSEPDISRYSLIHFAAHGLLDERNPRYSGLVLATSAEDEGYGHNVDGFLRTTEISALRLNADIVMLSACNTGIGRVLSGEGVLGLQRAFLNAGSSAVAVTLWSVEDRATSLLMRNFYQQLNRQYEERPRFSRRNTELNYKEALREAQLSLLENPQYAHPVNWASFVITGR